MIEEIVARYFCTKKEGAQVFLPVAGIASFCDRITNGCGSINIPELQAVIWLNRP